MSWLPDLGPRGEGWFALQVLLFVAIAIAAWFGGFALDAPLQLTAYLVGGSVFAVGLLLGALGVRDLGRSLSPLPRPIATGVLVRDGLYRYVRHPIYSSVLLVGLGGSIIGRSPAALLLTLALAILFDLKARREEAWLRERYADYAEYASRTRRFIPGVY